MGKLRKSQLHNSLGISRKPHLSLLSGRTRKKITTRCETARERAALQQAFLTAMGVKLSLAPHPSRGPRHGGSMKRRALRQRETDVDQIKLCSVLVTVRGSFDVQPLTRWSVFKLQSRVRARGYTMKACEHTVTWFVQLYLRHDL